MTENDVKTTRYDSTPSAHLVYLDSKSRIFRKELPKENLASIEASFNEVKRRPGPFPNDWMLSAFHNALDCRVFDYDLDDFKEVELNSDEWRVLVINALTDELQYIDTMSSALVIDLFYYAERRALRKLLELRTLASGSVPDDLPPSA